MTKKKKTFVVLDSHAVLHRAFHALPGFTSPKGEPTGALYGFVSTVLKTIEDFKPEYIVACFDLPEPTFRHEFYENYKAKRPKMESELSMQIEKAKEVLDLLGIPYYEKPGFEADDVLATVVEQMKPELKPQDIEIVIVTGDLDTLQLVQPGVKVYTMKRGINESIIYDTKAVKERFGFGPKLLPDFKGLMGDPSDNIIGVVGIGEKTAKTIIGTFGSLENVYKKLKKNKEVFEKAGIKPRMIKILEENEEEAFFSKALAEVRTDVPIDFILEDAVWGEGFDKEKVRDLFQELGFRTLFQRLPEKFKEEQVIEEEIDEDLEKRVKLAYWLLDSRKTNETIKDILFDTGVNTLSESLEVLESRIKKESFSDLYFNTEVPLIDIFKEMQKNGVLLDVDYLKKLSKDYNNKLDELQKKIWKLAGEEFNIKSPKQLSEILFTKMGISPKGMRKTSTGAISTRFSELEKIKDRHPVIEEIFSYRELAKLTSTYVDNLPGMVDESSRLHTTFNQTGTSTGRISSSEPNLQNIPVRSEFGAAVRKAFVAPKGYSLVSFDYSQIELRIAAALSGDEKLIDAFKTGVDIHAKVASEVFNTPFDEVTSNMRRSAKVINFGILYGMGINSLKKNLDCSMAEARNFYDEYFHDFQGMADYIEESKQEVANDGYTKTLLGRRRYLPEINSPIIFIKKEAERMAVNAPIQGTAADIIKIAMVKLDKLLKEKGFDKDVNLVLQIHDELIYEIKEDKIKEIAPVIEATMEEENLLGEVPVVVDILVGPNWGELKRFE